MSEELDNKQENTKRVIKNKEVGIIEKYQFKDDSVELITDSPTELSIKKNIEVDLIKDIPSKSLNKKSENKTSEVKNSENIYLSAVKDEKKIIIKSNKELYESFINEMKYYSLSINEDVIYDSSIDKSNDYPVKFENDYFVVFGKKYSYNGLKIKKININK